MEKSADALLVGLQTVHQVALEALHAVAQDARAVQQVADHHRLEHVELELAVHAANRRSHVVTHDLGAHHGERLALGGVDLARHDRGTRLVLGQHQLAQTAAGARAEVADVLRDLEQGAGQSVQRARGLDHGVVRGQHLELVGGRLELGAGHLGDLGGDGLVKALEGVQAGADGGTALGEEAEVGQAVLDTLDVAVELGDVAGELLAQSQGSGVLQMGTADLDDLLELVDLLLESVAQALQRRQQSTLELQDGGNVHRSGEGVVGRGGHVDVVVGVDGLLGAHGATQDLNGTVRDNLVAVHVGLGAGAGLPHDQGEVVEQLALGDLGGGLLDRLTNLGVCRAQIDQFRDEKKPSGRREASYQGQTACSQWQRRPSGYRRP